MGNRVSRRAADSVVAPSAMAAAKRLARRRRIGTLLFRFVLHPLQYRARLHDGGPRQSCAVDLAATNHAGWRFSRHRIADDAQIGRRRHRRAWRFCRARVGSCRRSRRRLARRVDHDWRGSLHGVLQCLVTRLYPALERTRISGRRHGFRRGRAGSCRPVERPARGAGKLRCAAMDRRYLSWNWRRRAWRSFSGCSLCSERARRAWPIP